jgi:hypothetical protein
LRWEGSPALAGPKSALVTLNLSKPKESSIDVGSTWMNPSQSPSRVMFRIHHLPVN